MKDIYICTGQYHIFCSVLLKLTNNRENQGDLVICNCFEGADKLYNNLHKLVDKFDKETGYFNNVYFINDKEYKNLEPDQNPTTIKKVFKSIRNKFLIPENKLKNIISDKYSRIYIAGAVSAMVDYCIHEHVINGSEIVLFDDGLGSRLQWEEPKFRTKIFDYNRINQFWNLVKKKTFFSPDRVCNIFPYVDVDKQCKPNEYEINQMGLNYDLIQSILNDIFSYSEDNNPLLDNDIIYFSAGFDLYDWLKVNSDIEVKIINDICEKYNNILVKRHPNSKEEYNNNIKQIDNMCNPEICFLNTNIDNKLIISSGSSTLFNPSFVFDKNPYVILTYKLFGKENQLSYDLFKCDEDELKNRLKTTLYSGYKDKSKIYIPNTISELYDNINDYIKKVNRG